MKTSPQRIFRTADWWEFKLTPVLALFYGAALARGAPLLPLTPVALLLLAAVAVCAAFVSAINDASDIRVDSLAGKANAMEALPPAARAAFIAMPLLAGLGVCVLWRRDASLTLAYLGSYAAFTLYSVPPFRLKSRGALGVAADAAGAHLFPALTAVLLAWQAMKILPDQVLLVAAAVWALSYGLRGIFWHQLGDVDADRAAGVRTLPRVIGERAVQRFGERAVFPVELAALAILLWRMNAALGYLFLAQDAALSMLHYRRFGRIAPVIRPRPGEGIQLQRYYGFWLPAAIMLQSALRYPTDLLLLPMHMALFPSATRRAAAALWHLVKPGTSAAT